MHPITLEIIRIITSPDSIITNAYNRLKFISQFLEIASKAGRVVATFGLFILWITIKDILYYRTMIGDFWDGLFLGITGTILPFSIMLFIEFLKYKYTRALGISDRFNLILENIINDDFVDTTETLLDIESETRESNNFFLTRANCVSVLFLLEIFKAEIEPHILEGVLIKLSRLEAFSICEGLVLWGKSRIYLETSNKAMAELYLSRFHNSSDFSQEASRELEELFAVVFPKDV